MINIGLRLSCNVFTTQHVQLTNSLTLLQEINVLSVLEEIRTIMDLYAYYLFVPNVYH